MSEKVRFEPNVPETLALKFQVGKAFPSKFAGGDQVMFSFTDGRVAFVSGDVAAQIDALELAVGEPFTVCKRSGKWQIERANVQQPPVTTAAAVRTMSQPHSDNDQRSTPPEKLPMDKALGMFLVMAGRSALQAQGILQAEGSAIAFDQRDVAALATTCFIQASKKGWIGWISPENLQSYVCDAKIRSLQASPAPVEKKAPQAEVQIPQVWKTRGEMKQVFSQLRELVGETDYFRVLGEAKVQDAAQFHYLNDAMTAYNALVTLVKAAA